MCTIIRVKRKITEDPVDCLIIECKRNKLINGKSLGEIDQAIDKTQLNEQESLESSKSSHKISNGTSAKESIKEVLKYAGSAKTEVN